MHASNASTYVKYNVEYIDDGEITRTNIGSATQERPEGFWQAARRDFEDSIVETRLIVRLIVSRHVPTPRRP